MKKKEDIPFDVFSHSRFAIHVHHWIRGWRRQSYGSNGALVKRCIRGTGLEQLPTAARSFFNAGRIP